MTPRASSSGDSDAIAAYAPRSLNAPIGWSDSALRKRRSAGGPKATSGVRSVTPAQPLGGGPDVVEMTSPPGSARIGLGRRFGRHQRSRAAEALAVDAAGRPRQRLEPIGADRPAAADARPERPGLEPGERLLDEDQLLVGPVAQGQVALLGEDLAGGRGLRAVGHLAGRHDRLADLGEQAARARRAGWRGSGRGRGRPSARWYGNRILHGSTDQGDDDGHRDRSGLRDGGRHDDQHSCPLEHDGTTYWFCGKGCLLDFQDDPAGVPARRPRHEPAPRRPPAGRISRS